MTASDNRDAADETAVIAYGIWESEGRPVGRDKEHWLIAEEIVTGQPVAADSMHEAKADTPASQQEDHTHVRPAGRKKMDMPPSTWSRTDEEVDESFPASDPPGNY